jgi:hypothetical protein
LIFIYLNFALFKHCGEILEAQVQALEAMREANLQRMEALEAQRVAEQQMVELLRYMQTLGQRTGVALPALLFVPPPPPPPEHATPVNMSMIV